MDGNRSRGLLRRTIRGGSADGTLLSRPGPGGRRSAATTGMRAALASAPSRAVAGDRAHAPRRLLCDPLLPSRAGALRHGRNGAALSPIPAALPAAAASELAHHG